MSRALLRYLLLALLLLALPAFAQAAPGASCRSYLIYDYTGQQVVAVENPDNRQPVASLSKLMTAILACENLRFDGRYLLNDEEQKAFKTDSLRADKILELMLVASNNLACKTVARIVAGDESSFAQMMSARARDFGMNNTRYVNASGLPGEGQYSTMEDMLRLTLVALQYPRIRETMTCHDCIKCGGQDFKPTLGELYARHPGLIGGKTGYTKAAGRCLVLLYNSHGRDYIVITFGSSGVKASFKDAETLLKYHGLYDGPVGEWK
ncbi:D-alanyl-D-alanine carboxypeptidase [bacterium]|nr:D-alanyl-D-alanine carboxypeptidase [bacterium]